MIYLDTHLVVWLYVGASHLLSEAARRAIDRHELCISPIVALEVQYLFEVGKIADPGERIISDLARRIGLTTCHLPFADVVTEAMRQRWTRDPFDRIIVAQASLTTATLVTKDETMRAHYRHALWD